LTFVVLLLGFAVQGQLPTQGPPYRTWKTFSSRAGWKMKYPELVHISSCRNCTDVHDPDIFVSFFDVKTGESMMVDPLIGRPNGRSLDDWLLEISRTVYLSQQLGHKWITLAGQRALRVDYRNADGTETECTYLVGGRHTLRIHIDLHGRSTALFQEMLNTFRFANTSR
jgi:hypothetical protein